MVPAESLLEGSRKMMRDLARDEGKPIEFRPACSGVRADRRVLEALKDPIMHLLRNAVSHGIEPTAERVAQKKDRVGQVLLRIDADGQRLTVTVQDDGRGVDLARVTEVAVRDGILAEADAQRSSQDLIRLLFRPGFSTATSITKLSGRGMGLSVVYEMIRRFQGELSVLPAEGGGTIITVSVPLSIATHRMVVVRCGEHDFAIPILGIDRLTRVRVSDIQTIEGKPVLLWGEQPVRLASIPGLLGFNYSPAHSGEDMLPVVVVRSGTRRVALAVDEIVKEVDAVVQDLGPAAGFGGRIASGAVLEAGSIALVVNPMELVEGEVTPHSNWRLSQAKAVATAEPVPHSILVVDDSLTTRTLEKSILEAHGYRVRVAVDGVEALLQLRREIPDLVISDIEMPRLNGFGLLEAIKQDTKLAHIPVIMVSSIERREDQERGLALGADAYIVKRKFQQEELLATIRQIL
jgi:two-component system chemotaxis sensor kinase CheA